MNKEVVKQLLVRDKGFLRELYESQSPTNIKRLLNFASDSKLNTLLKFLHFLAIGEIRIKKANFEIIKSEKRLTYIKKHVETKVGINRLVKAERKQKLKFLNHLACVYANLLYCLFNEN
jgi:hypothetical protein